MANSPPSIKDNPFKRLDALRNKVSGVKAPAPAAAAPPVPARRPSDASTAPAPPVPPQSAPPKLPPRRPSDASTASNASTAPKLPPRRGSSTASHASTISRRHSLPGQPLPLPTTLRTPATSDDHEDRPLPPLPTRHHASDGDWAECTDLSTGKRGKVPASAIQEVKETSAAAPTTAPEKKKGYTYSSLPSLTGGPKRKIFKQPKRR